MQTVLLVVVACGAYAVLPRAELPRSGSLWRAWASIPRVVAADRAVLGICVSGLLIGISFGAFWTTLTFLLADGYGLGATVAGAFGLVAAASALTSPYAGRLADRRGGGLAQIVVLTVALAGWLTLGFGMHGLLWIVLGTVLLDVGVWSNQVVNQTALFSRPQTSHNRLNTAYFTLRFGGISVGSLIGSMLWVSHGWGAVTALAIAVLVVASPLAVVSSRALPTKACPPAL